MRAAYMGSSTALIAMVAAVVLAGTITVRADVIDGDWCFGTKTLSIHGPRIRTPGGTDMDGSYSRHSFDYVVPAGEPDAGGAIALRLLNEETMMLSRGATATAAPETWRRCKPVS